MARYLVIVESPAKVKTIKKFLGSSYVVTASNGHVRDLPKSTLGIDVEHDFEPKYINIRGKADLIKSLKKDAKNGIFARLYDFFLKNETWRDTIKKGGDTREKLGKLF